MPWFKRFIYGKDFPGRIAGQKRRVGLRDARVNASSEEEADSRQFAIENRSIVEVPRLSRFKNSQSNVYLDGIEQIPDYRQLV
jgi:hypothetical protein